LSYQINQKSYFKKPKSIAMKKFIYILLFSLATTISISAHTEKAVAQNNNNDGPIGGFVSDPK
jgi:hypothetical protein